MNMKKILTALFASAFCAGALTVAAMAADFTATNEAELKSALETAEKGDTITVNEGFSLTEELVIGDGVSLVAPDVSGEFHAVAGANVTVDIENAKLIADGDIDFVGVNTVNGFDFNEYDTTITIGKGASLAVVGSGRVIVGYGSNFIIEGGIIDAKVTNKDDVVPSLDIAAGISISGDKGAKFSVKNAYISLGLTQSKNYGATDTFDFSFKNSIADFKKNLTFSTSTNGATPTFNIRFEDSVINLGSNFDLANAACNVVIDNSNVTVSSSFRNDGKLDIVNGSEFVVNAQIQAGEHGGNSGVITVDSSELVIECSSKGHAFDSLGKGTLIANNATVDIDYIKDTSIVTFGNSNVISNSTDIVVVEDPVAEVDGAFFTDIQEAFKTMKSGSVFTLLDDVIIDYYWDCRYTGTKFTVPVTINGNGHTLTFKETVYDGGNHFAAFRFEADATVKNLTVDMANAISGFGGRFRAISAKADLVVDGCTFIGNGSANNTRAIIFGEGAGSAIADVDVEITDCEFIGWRYGVSDNENAQDANTVVIDKCEFEDASVQISASEEITFTNNTLENGWINVAVYDKTADLTVTVTGNTFEENGNTTSTTNRIQAGSTIIVDEHVEDVILPVAKIGSKGYFTIEEAIAKALEGETILIVAGEYDAFTVPADKNNLTFVGETDDEGNNLVTIRTMEEDIETVTKGIHTKAETLTFKNLDFISGTAGIELYKGNDRTWMTSAIGVTNGSVGDASSGVLLKNLTIENCNFEGSGAYNAIWVRKCNLTVKNCTISGYELGIENYAFDDGQISLVENCEITDVYTGLHSATAAAGSEWKVTGSYIDANVISVSNEAKVNIENSTIKNATLVAYRNVVMNITNTALYDTAIKTAHDTASIKLEEVFVNNLNDISAAAEANANIAFTTYYPTEEDLEKQTNLKEVPNIADAIYVEFVKVDVDAENKDTDEQADLYNINLVAKEETINRLNSVDLTFVLTQVVDADGNNIGKNEFEIIASNGEIVINPVNNSTNRYEFHYNGKDGVKTDTGSVITIGQVKFTGYGKYNFAVDANADTNAAHATTLGDNIVDTFVPNGDETTVADGELVINDDTITNVLIAVPTRDLEIVIDFPNAVKANNNYKYQDMKVVVSGGELAEAIVIDLGAEAVMPNLVTDVKTEAKAEVVITDKYVVTLTDVLEVNNAYNVEVSGAGYRTAKYTVTMTEDKTLNFWNNVKDNAVEVEEKKASSAKNVTFLAGDIVKDSVINIYDLSAVVSYFGEIDLNKSGEYNAYAKYDLNRDGKIDSKDVAYVLVSWGK